MSELKLNVSLTQDGNEILNINASLNDMIALKNAFESIQNTLDTYTNPNPDDGLGGAYQNHASCPTCGNSACQCKTTNEMPMQPMPCAACGYDPCMCVASSPEDPVNGIIFNGDYTLEMKAKDVFMQNGITMEGIEDPMMQIDMYVNDEMQATSIVKGLVDAIHNGDYEAVNNDMIGFQNELSMIPEGERIPWLKQRVKDLVIGIMNSIENGPDDGMPDLGLPENDDMPA